MAATARGSQLGCWLQARARWCQAWALLGSACVARSKLSAASKKFFSL